MTSFRCCFARYEVSKCMLLEIVLLCTLNLSFCIFNILLLLCVCLSVFGNMIAIDADYTTDFKFHPTIGCCCFNSHNDISQVAERNVSIIPHTRHRRPFFPQPDCCCCVPFLTTTSLSHSLSPPRRASQRNVSMAAERGVERPSIAQPDCCCCVSILITTTPPSPHLSRIDPWPQNGPMCLFMPQGRYLSQVFDAFVFLRKHSVQTGDFSESFRNHFLFTLTTNMIVTSPPEYLHENAMQKNKKINLEEMAV